MVKVTFDIEIDRSLPRCVGKGDNTGDRSFLDPGRMDGGQGWDKSSDIKGVNNGYWGGVGGINSPILAERAARKKMQRKRISAKVEKNFPAPRNQILSPIFNQGKGQSHYKTPQIEQKEKEWLCLKFWPFEPSIYVKEIYSKLQKDFHRTNEK